MKNPPLSTAEFSYIFSLYEISENVTGSKIFLAWNFQAEFVLKVICLKCRSSEILGASDSSSIVVCYLSLLSILDS